MLVFLGRRVAASIVATSVVVLGTVVVLFVRGFVNFLRVGVRGTSALFLFLSTTNEMGEIQFEIPAFVSSSLLDKSGTAWPRLPCA